MAEPRIRVKVNLFHDVRNHDADVSEIEEQIVSSLNHVHERVEGVRIAVGHSAGAVFITLSDKRFTLDDITSNYRLTHIISETVRLLERFGYASNVRKDNVRIEAVSTRPDRIDHKFDVGDYALDSCEPTPSPEANTVEIVELINARADEYEIEETGQTVAEHNPYFPKDDAVVVGVYPNMSGDDKRFHFPETRLREV